MNGTRKSNHRSHISQGVDPRRARTRIELKIAGYLLLIAVFLTTLGIYTVWLKMEIDCKYLQLDVVKTQNHLLDIRIKKLEAEVGALNSYQKVESTIRAAGYQMVVPEKVVYIRLDDRQESMIRAEGAAPRPDGNVN